MDVQGAETTAINGSAELLGSRKIKLVFCEVRFLPMDKHGCDFADVSTAMKNLDCTLYELSDLYHFPSDGLMWGDAIFVNRESLLSGNSA